MSNINTYIDLGLNDAKSSEWIITQNVGGDTTKVKSLFSTYFINENGELCYSSDNKGPDKSFKPNGNHPIIDALDIEWAPYSIKKGNDTAKSLRTTKDLADAINDIGELATGDTTGTGNVGLVSIDTSELTMSDLQAPGTKVGLKIENGIVKFSCTVCAYITISGESECLLGSTITPKVQWVSNNYTVDTPTVTLTDINGNKQTFTPAKNSSETITWDNSITISDSSITDIITGTISDSDNGNIVTGAYKIKAGIPIYVSTDINKSYSDDTSTIIMYGSETTEVFNDLNTTKYGHYLYIPHADNTIKGTDNTTTGSKINYINDGKTYQTADYITTIQNTIDKTYTYYIFYIDASGECTSVTLKI